MHGRASIVLIGLLSTVGCQRGEQAADRDDRSATASEQAARKPGPIPRARAMTQTFASELSSTLLAAIEQGGPAHAIAVCKHQAPQIAAAQSTDGWTLSRTALRVRNPDNAPNDWQRPVLAAWQRQLEAKEIDDPTTLEWFETIEGERGLELRYMRAIVLGGVCLACHGPVDQIAEDVRTALAEQYPDDQATGFRVGELRGAFVVTGPL
ncbi:MAG TPA: DUF3365 domain-containing protein [Enhygromyxa sp.]|nr:DUF3365 domain-containing protein [Enhygromyxa sp.]